MRISMAGTLSLILGTGLLVNPFLKADPVSWGDNTSGNTAAGILNATAIPTTGSVRYSNVNGGGYDIVITTTGLNFSGPGNLGVTAGPNVSWSIEGAAPAVNGGSIPYSTINVRFYATGTTDPYYLTGVDFRMVDAEVDERFRNFSYFSAGGTQVSFSTATDPYGYSDPILSTSAANFNIHQSGDFSFDTGATAVAGTQTDKWIELNMSPLAISGFQFQAGRPNTGPGGVEVTAIGNLVHQLQQIAAGASVAGRHSYDGLASTSTLPSGARTQVRLLGGTASANTTVDVDFSLASTTGFQAGAGHLSDVVSLHGTNNDKVVLQLSYDETALGPTQLESDVYVGWFDSGGALVNAVNGNSDLPGEPNAPSFHPGAYDPATDFHLGYYGVDTVNDVAWAVIDHNSEFTAAPEPASAGLAAIGALTLLSRRRRKG